VGHQEVRSSARCLLSRAPDPAHFRRPRIVVLEGPKACGKTETALQVAQSVVRLDIDTSTQLAVAADPLLVLEGKSPRLIDEWQTEPAIWNHAPTLTDERKLNGQFILTGSSVPDEDPKRHTGTGRFSFIRMRPMSLFESGESVGTVSLSALMAGELARSVATSFHRWN